MNAPLLCTTMDSPIGTLLLAGDCESLSHLNMLDAPRPFSPPASWRREDAPFAEATRQLAEYFAGSRHEFDLPLALHGNEFELRVWAALQEIPYGETASYGQIARAIGAPTAARAVGLANGRNPIALIVPCHRVIGANGSLTGYGGGLPRKRYLLDLETGALPIVSALTA